MMAGGLVCIGGYVTSMCGMVKKRKAGRNLSNLTIGVQESGVGIALLPFYRAEVMYFKPQN
jgi:hypothetical protein